MPDEYMKNNRRKDNKLGIPMRIVAGFLAFFGWKYLYLAITNPTEYLEKGINFQTLFSIAILFIAISLLTMGALIGKVPKKFTDAARKYDNESKN